MGLHLSLYIFNHAPLYWFNFIFSRANSALAIAEKNITVFSQWRHKGTRTQAGHHFRPGLLTAFYDTGSGGGVCGQSNLNGFWHIL